MGGRLRRGLVRLVTLVAAACVLAACQNKSLATYVDGMRSTESVRGGEPEKSIDELQREIKRYRAEVERTVKASESLGTYYRLLGTAYMNRQMYGEALQSFEQAIKIYPENEQLTYFVAVCAARMSKAQNDEAERARLLTLSEQYYKRTLFLFPDHRPALFGLAVIYAAELNRPAEALPLLDRLLAKDTSNVEARTLLARTHVALGNYEEALASYREIASASVSAEIKQQALDNAKEIEGRLTGSGSP